MDQLSPVDSLGLLPPRPEDGRGGGHYLRPWLTLTQIRQGQFLYQGTRAAARDGRIREKKKKAGRSQPGPVTLRMKAMTEFGISG